MTRRFFVGLAVVLVGSVAPAHGPVAARAGAPVDRLERFRELAQTRLTTAGVLGGEPGVGSYREIYELLDEEIIESLQSGGVFASEGFLQDRLDAFTEVWGGATARVARVGRVIVAAIRLADAIDGGTVRVYGRYHGEAVLLSTMRRDGAPSLYPMEPATGGAPQLVVLWEGARSARGTTAIRVDLLRLEGDTLRIAWTSADRVGDDLQAWTYAVRLPEITLRYELRYPGWVPGCEGQTEQEDLFRYSPVERTFGLARRRVHQAWHRDLHGAVEALRTALHARDRRRLEELVPDARVRTVLPAELTPEPACDLAETMEPVTVTVPVLAERQPWALRFRRVGSGWRLSAAGPVIESTPTDTPTDTRTDTR